MRFGYFESELTGYDENGLPIFDRAEDDEFFTRVWRYLLRNGIMSEPADNMMVSAVTGMTVRVNKGFGVIQGKFAYEDIAEQVTLEEANEVYPRIDAIVLRLDLENRKIEIAAKTGIAAVSPKTPDLEREDEGIYELCLAYIRVEAGVTEIKSSNITDKRNDLTVCGLIQAVANVNDKNVRMSVPSQAGSIIYNGETQTPKWYGYDEEVMDISGDEEGLEPGTYITYFRPHEGYAWSDGSTLAKEVEWTIQKISVQSPTFAAYNFPYDGNNHTVSIQNYDSSLMSKSGDETGKNAGSYSVIFVLLDSAHYMWSTTGLSVPLTVKWNIGIVVETPTITTPSLVYTGSGRTPTVDYDSENINATIASGTIVGTYTIDFSLKNPEVMVWEDGGVSDKQLSWSITKKSITVPTLNANPEFTGSNVSPTLNNFNSSWMSISNNLKTDVGTYTATVTLTDTTNTQWADGTTSAKSVSWEITAKYFTIPSDPGSGNTYTGSSVNPTLTGFDSAWMTKTVGTCIEPGTYECTVSLNNKQNTKWTDGTTTDKIIHWTLRKKNAGSIYMYKPSGYSGQTYATSTQYNGEELDVLVGSENGRLWFTYPSSYVTVSGTTKATNPGAYSTTFTVKDPTHYEFSDGASALTKSWSITQGTGSISVYRNGSPYTGTLIFDFANVSSYEIEIVGNNGDTISLDVNSGIFVSTKFACTLNGNKITISAGSAAGGSSTVNIFANETEKYTRCYCTLKYSITSA